MKKEVNVITTNELKIPTQVGRHYRLLCMTGPSKGKVYYLTGKRIIIGRGDRADIQVVDVKMSREHAELSFTGDGYTITDLNTQNGILINSIKVKQKKAIDADKLVIGQTVLKYNVYEVKDSEGLVELNEGETLSKESIQNKKAKTKVLEKLIARGESLLDKRKETGASKKSNPKGLIAIVLIIGGGFLFIDNNDQPKQEVSENKQSDGLRDLEKDPVSLSDNKKNSQEDAESKKRLDNYIHSGRREFGEGNYFRAMEDFRLALLLSPNNGHASFYLSKAKQSLDDDINKNFIKAKQESESKKFQAAIVSYCGVVQLIQNYPNDERYKNAMMKISALESELGMEKGEVKCIEEKSAASGN